MRMIFYPRKPTSKERKKERKKETYIHTLIILLWLSSSVSILSKHHILLSFLPFPSIIKKKSVSKKSSKKKSSGEEFGRGIIQR